MPHTPAVHPSSEILAAFTQGRLRPEDAEKIRRHLDLCEACRAVLGPSRGETRAAGMPDTQVGISPGGSAAEATVPPELAAHPKFRVLRLLGQGGMGAVYLAEHRLMKRQVAIKVVNRLLVENPDAIGRFMQEIEAVSRLDHPHIARAHDAEQAGGLHLLVMEYVPGQDLEQVVRTYGPLAPAAACLCLRQAAEGLQHAFERGMVHRDLKPNNLRVTPERVVKILDFGLAKLARERQGGGLTGGGLTRDNSLMGTPDYIAPEQATDAHKADIRADVYSLGCTAYFLLTGRPPFPEGTDVQKILAHLDRQPTPLRDLRPDVPPGLEAIVARMMAKDPNQRYSTPAELLQALAELDQPSETAPSTGPKPSTVWDDLATPAGAGTATAAAKPPGESVASLVSGKVWAAIAAGVLVFVAASGGLAWWATRPGLGTVVLKVEPPDTEVVIGDRTFPQPAPGESATLALPEGKYRVMAQKAGHREVRQEIQVRPGQTATLTLKLLRKQGTLVFQLHTPEASLIVDGNPVQVTSGSSPVVRLTLDEGKHEIVARKDGFQEAKREVTIQDGKENTVEAITLREVAATLVLTVTPPDAQLWLGDQRHEGPRTLKLAPGEYQLLVKKEGFKDRKETVNLQLGETKPLSISLEQRTGTVTLKVTPPEARLYVGGRLKPAGERITLPASKHSVEARLAGYEDFQRDIEVAEDRETPVEVVLTKRTLREVGRFDSHGELVRAGTFLPAGQVVSASSGKSASLRVWNSTSLKELHGSSDPSRPATALAVSPDGSRILSSHRPAAKGLWSVQLWSADGLKPMATVPIGKIAVAGLGFSPDNARAFVVGAYANVLQIDLAKPVAASLLPGSSTWNVTSAAFAPDSRRVAVATSQSFLGNVPLKNTLYLLDLDSDRQQKLLAGHKSAPGCVAFSPDGSQLVSGDSDGVLVWTTRATFRDPLLRVISVKTKVHCVAFTRDGGRVLTGCEDGTVRLWDVKTGDQLDVFAEHKLAVRCVAVAPDGQHAISGSDDGSLRVLRLP